MEDLKTYLMFNAELEILHYLDIIFKWIEMKTI